MMIGDLVNVDVLPALRTASIWGKSWVPPPPLHLQLRPQPCHFCRRLVQSLQRLVVLPRRPLLPPDGGQGEAAGARGGRRLGPSISGMSSRGCNSRLPPNSSSSSSSSRPCPNRLGPNSSSGCRRRLGPRCCSSHYSVMLQLLLCLFNRDVCRGHGR